MVRTLAEQIKQYRRPAVLAPVFTALESVMEVLIPFIIASLIDKGIEKGDMSQVWRYGLLMLAAAFASLLFGIAGTLFSSEASTGFAANLRDAMYRRIQSFSFSSIDRFSTAGLVTRMTTDVTNLQNAFHMMMRIAVRGPINMILAVIMCVIISPSLSVVFVYALVFLVIATALLLSRAVKIFQQVFSTYDELNAGIEENVEGIRVVKAFVREKYESGKFDRAVDKLYSLYVRAEKIVVFINPVMTATIYGCLTALSWLGAKQIVAGTLTTGELTSLFAYVMTILMGFMMISMIVVMLTMSAASAKRICQVLTEEPDIVNGENPVYEVKDGSVDFDRVSFRYGSGEGDAVLRDIDLHIKSGETVGIIGATGCGKTSLVSLIPRLYDTTAGCVKVGGVPVRRYDIKTLRDRVSVVLQKNTLFSGTVLENLRWGDGTAGEKQCRQACIYACADEFIQEMPDGYNSRIEQGGANLSGGQRQRLCIARALLKSPDILILDDSTSAVDTATESKIIDAFKKRLSSMTCFIISQRISSVKDADRILVMDNGMVSGFDTHENLLKTNTIYSDIYELQSTGGGDFDMAGGAK